MRSTLTAAVMVAVAGLSGSALSAEYNVVTDERVKAERTASIVHSAIDRSASWRMNPSQVSPISFSAFGP